ncbi:MAG: ABC transporter permease [Candidatus Latescibacteria bacterium]|nr:ABC transporter permease [Candidatus Latescibacterota bacterium]
MSLSRAGSSGITPLNALLLIIVIGGAVAAVFGPQLLPSQLAGGIEPLALPPGAGHLLGTDSLGRDMLARLLEGMRTTLFVGLAATLLALVIGTLYGAAAGLAGPRADETMMRGVDVALALPFMLLVILLVSLFGRSMLLLFVALGLVAWLPLARVARAGVHNLREEPYLEAARMMGGSRVYVLRAHLFPQLGAPLAVYATWMLPVVMMQEAFLSFLGLGVAPPRASWGTLIADGVARIETAPWILLSAGGSLALWLIALHLAGERLARQLNVHRTTGALERTTAAGEPDGGEVTA